MNFSVDILSVPVADQDRAKAFYTEKLGFTVRADEPMDSGQRWVQLQPPAGGASITLVTWFDAMAPGSLRGVVLGVDDADASYAELRSRGVPFSGELEDAPWGRYATFSDPDGNGFVLVGPVLEQ